MLFVSFWYSCQGSQPKYPATMASTTSTEPRITDVRVSRGSRRLSKMVVNSGYLPPLRYRPFRPG